MPASTTDGATDGSADSRRSLLIAALLLFSATALGAFGTHALKPVLTEARFDSFETAVTYQFYAGFGLLALGLLQRDARFAGARLRLVGHLLLAGVLLFAGSIYALTAGAPTPVVMLAPLGGTAMMAAWLLFAWSVARPSRFDAGAAWRAGSAQPRELELKVPQASSVPASRPRLNQVMRCCAVPWVKDSGST